MTNSRTAGRCAPSTVRKASKDLGGEAARCPRSQSGGVARPAQQSAAVASWRRSKSASGSSSATTRANAACSSPSLACARRRISTGPAGER